MAKSDKLKPAQAVNVGNRPPGSDAPKGTENASVDLSPSPASPETGAGPDAESAVFMNAMGVQDRLRNQRVAGVRNVLVVLSSKGMVFDMESLGQKILLAYPEAHVFFVTTDGKPVTSGMPKRVDLLIDLTGPGQRQGFLFARKVRGWSRVAVGRNAGLFRRRIYDRVFDEQAHAADLPADVLQRERYVQKEVLALAGVGLVQAGDALPDLGKSIATRLPPYQKL